MARGTVVTYEAVAKACQELFAAGQSTTFENVYKHEAVKQQGAAAIVKEHIKAWRKAIGEQLSAPRVSQVLPANLVEVSDKLVNQLWTQALTQADAVHAESEADLERQKKEMLVIVAEADARTAEAQRLAQTLEAQLAAVRMELQAAQAAAAQAAEHHAAVLALRDEQIANAKDSATRANEALERERQQLVDERRLHSEELSRARADLELWRQHAQEKTAK